MGFLNNLLNRGQAEATKVFRSGAKEDYRKKNFYLRDNPPSVSIFEKCPINYYLLPRVCPCLIVIEGGGRVYHFFTA